jgi:hypothetical protein
VERRTVDGVMYSEEGDKKEQEGEEIQITYHWEYFHAVLGLSLRTSKRLEIKKVHEKKWRPRGELRGRAAVPPHQNIAPITLTCLFQDNNTVFVQVKKGIKYV